ncbi:MAG: PAS domain S-box protein, partial [Bdellovibrionales bacterium]|nr:PAS domain S-box protein [Bdellovibrionales bacterium]
MNTQFELRLEEQRKKVDRLFSGVLLFQWILAVALAALVAPAAWQDADGSLHLRAGIGLGGLLTVFPVLHALFRPGAPSGRWYFTVAQMGFSALLIHVTGGRIETHFHVFGSLALISFYRDWRLVALATLVTLTDHLVRGFLWPQSVYGVLSATPWRAVEHALWVLFEDTFLFFGIAVSRRELRRSVEGQLALREALYNSERNLQLADKLRHTLDTVAIVSVTDPDGTILDVNRNFEIVSGYSRAELLGKNHRMLKSGLHTQEEFTELWATLQRGEIWRGEVCNRAKDGSLHWLDTRIVPVKDPSGKIAEFVAIRLD